MRKLHNFDEVFDGQKVFRTILEAMSNPGRRVSISEQAEKMYGEHSAFLAIAMTLLDNEVSFFACGNQELAENISLLTLSAESSLENADFIFVEKDEMLDEVFQMAKCGTLENPQKSATIIIKVSDACNTMLNLFGAGIDGALKVEVPCAVEKALELRKQQNYEYPQGVDMIFVTGNGKLFCIPRLVMKEEEQ